MSTPGSSSKAGDLSAQAASAGDRIDRLMDAASGKLLDTAYFDTIALCERAMGMAVKAADWDRLARIALPLQEARRQVRQIAVDAAAESGVVRIADTQAQLRKPAEPGCYLIQPPLIGAEARAFRVAADKREVPVFVLAREPMSASGEWPVVGVSSISIRTKVAPPAGVQPAKTGPTRDTLPESGVMLSWFESAAEDLGDAAIASVDPGWPAAHRVEDLVERLDALPEHEKLHQALAEAARQAMREPAPAQPRRRGPDHMFSF